MKEDERNYKFQKDLEIILQNTTFSWIKHFLMDLKRLTSVKFLFNLIESNFD